MNNKFIVLATLMCTSLAYAGDSIRWLELKPSYFIFSASPMKHIYRHGGFQLQGSVSVGVCDHLAVYGSIGYRTAHGHALTTCQTTTLTVIPIDIGIKPILRIHERLYYFCAIGPRYFHVHQHNRSSYVDCKLNGNGIGVCVDTGFNALAKDCFLLGVFGNYSYEKKQLCPTMPNVFSNGPIQIGGFAVGVSLGYTF